MENTDPAAEGGPFIDEQTFQLKRLEKRLRMTTTVVLVETKDGDVQDGGEIVGYAHWEVPKSSTFAPALSDETEKEVQEVEPVPPTYDREANRRIGEEFEAETKKALGENGYKDMWCMCILFPLFQVFVFGTSPCFTMNVSCGIMVVGNSLP